jgi:hypothetical protein
MFTANSLLAVVLVKFRAWRRLSSTERDIENERRTWMYTNVADVPVPGFRQYWTQKLPSLKSEYHTITNKFPEAASVVQ